MRTHAIPVLVALALLYLAGGLVGAGGPPAAPADLLCVETGGGHGCYPTIGGALAAAHPGDTIRVATGVYTENVLVTQTLTLQGGWNLDFTVRDPAQFPSTVRPADPSHSVVDVEGTFGDPGAVAPTLDGFVVTGGRGDLGGNHGGGVRLRDSDALVVGNVITDNIGYLYGGGVWVQRGGPTLQNNRIADNRVTDGGDGGGVELEDTQAVLSGNTVSGNVLSDTTGLGGGIAVLGGGPVLLSGNQVLSNTAAITGSGQAWGGGVAAQGVTVTLSGNLIAGNLAHARSFGYGGGVFITGTLAFTLTGNTIRDNTASLAGVPAARPAGAVLGYGGGLDIWHSTGMLRGNTIQTNRATVGVQSGLGGGIHAAYSQIDARGDVIDGNTASGFSSGGGIALVQSRLTLDAARLEGNTAGPMGGDGGALDAYQSPYTLTTSSWPATSSRPRRSRPAWTAPACSSTTPSPPTVATASTPARH